MELWLRLAVSGKSTIRFKVGGDVEIGVGIGVGVSVEIGDWARVCYGGG